MAGVSIDPTIKLTPSPQLVEFLQLQQFDSPPPSRVQSLLDDQMTELTVEDIKWLLRAAPNIPSSFLLSSSLHLPSPVFPERNPELEARCQKLRAEQEEAVWVSVILSHPDRLAGWSLPNQHMVG